MSERKQILLRVSESQKENWERYQEELGFGSRASMIRRSVEYFYATQTGSGNDELQDDISTQLDSINRQVVNLQAEVSEMHADQLERDDIPDIAEEIDYLTEHQVIDWLDAGDTAEDLEADDIPFDGLDEWLLARDNYHPDDPQATNQSRLLAGEALLTGFDLAVQAIQHPTERNRLEVLYDEFRDELNSIDRDQQ